LPTSDLQSTLVEVERLLRPSEFDKTVTEQGEPPHERRRVAIRLGNLDRLAKVHDRGVRVALQKRDEPEFRARSVGPGRLIELLCQGEHLGPGTLGQRWIEVFVGFTLDDQHAQAKPFVATDQRSVEVFAQALRHLRDCQLRQLAPQAVHFSVQGVPLITSSDECFTCLCVQRFCSSPHAKPGEAISFGEQFLRVGDLRDSGGVLKKREQRTDDADQVKTAARHDSLPRFAGAPWIFYNRLPRVSSSKVVIDSQWQRSVHHRCHPGHACSLAKHRRLSSTRRLAGTRFEAWLRHDGAPVRKHGLNKCGTNGQSRLGEERGVVRLRDLAPPPPRWQSSGSEWQVDSSRSAFVAAAASARRRDLRSG
jgi:hypothetical protein